MRLYNVVHILVGTPGRVLDLADKGIANLKECNTLIMDEARLAIMRLPSFHVGGGVHVADESLAYFMSSAAHCRLWGGGAWVRG